jgi:presenilin-like A22 family membrane protease
LKRLDSLKPYLQVVLFFAITQLIGIYSGVALITSAQAIPEIREMSVAPLPEQNDPLNALIFLGYILFGAAMIILVARFYKGMALFQLLEFLVVSSSSSIVFFTVALSLLQIDFVLSMLIGMIIGFGLGAVKFFWQDVKNVTAIISSGGVAAIFGFSLGFLPTVCFIILLSIYDYVAVFKTKHMIEMARELSTRQLSFAVTAKELPARKAKEKTEAYVERAMREGERLDLGTGDLSVPAMISVSAYSLGPNGLVYSFAVAVGSTLALYFLLKFVSKQRVFLPALPPICLGGMLGLLIVKLIGF